MLTNRIARVHHNKVPSIGSIVISHVDDRHLGGAPALGHRYRRFIVTSYPGFRNDGFAPFSDGHLVRMKSLDNGDEFTHAAHWLEVID